MTRTVEHIANLANLLEEPLQEKLWEYAELLYVEQIVFESTDPSLWTIESVPNPDAFASP
jgi:hypothetical protein